MMIYMMIYDDIPFTVQVSKLNRLFTVPYFFVRSFRYTQLQKRCHRKMKKGKSQIGITRLT